MEESLHQRRKDDPILIAAKRRAIAKYQAQFKRECPCHCHLDVGCGCKKDCNRCRPQEPTV